MELYQLNKVVSDKGIILDAGIDQIQIYIRTQYLDRGEWQTLNPHLQRTTLPSLPIGWEWKWVLNKGQYRGTFPKRVRKYWHEQGIKCPDSFIQVLGEIAKRHTTDGVIYQFEFVNKFDWSEGDFGDDGSCFWDGHEAAKAILEENEALAIRFYDENGDGFARAWVAQTFEADSPYIVFNGYGLGTIKIAQITAEFLKASYKQIRLVNYGNASGMVWINGAAGYIVGKPEKIKEIDSWDLRYEEEYVNCHNCGDTLHYSDSYRGADDYDYCSDCFYQFFDSCYYCGEPYESGTLAIVNGDTWCSHCKRNRR